MGVILWTGSASGDVGSTSNYSTGALPTAADDLYVEASPTGTDVAMDTNLASLAAVALNSLNISQTFTAGIGTSAAYFQIKATTVNIGYQFGGSGNASGSGRVKINLGSSTATVNIYNSANSATDPNVQPVQLLGSALVKLNVTAGSVCIAPSPSETASITTVNNSGTLQLGSGVTLTTINNSGAILVRSAATAINCEGGTVTTFGSGAIATLTLYSGASAILNSTGTITTMNLVGSADFSGDANAKTVTTLNVWGGASLNLDNGVKGSITITNPIATQRCRPNEVNIIAWPQSTTTFG